MSSISTFEILPDEILLIIIRYCGDAYSICKSFFGLNQRLISIVIDKRLHVFADLLHMNRNDPDINLFYNSNLFYEISHQFLCLKAKQTMKEFLQLLISFYIKEKYKQLNEEFQFNLKKFQFQRLHLTDNEINNLDNELNRTFSSLPIDFDSYRISKPKEFFSQSIKSIKQIESLILTQGASFQYDEFNFGMIINKWFISKMNFTQDDNQQFLNSFIQMFKSIFISNLSLFKIKSYETTYEKINSPFYFLIYSIYQLKYFPDDRYEPNHSLKIHWYKAEINLFLSIVDHLFNEEFVLEHCLFEILDKTMLIVPSTFEEIFIRTSQIEILKILLHKYNQYDKTTCEQYDSFLTILYNLFHTEQLDIIQLIYKESRNIQYLFYRLETCEEIVNIMIKNREKKHLFQILLNDEQLRIWFINKDLLFILLKKKQMKIIKYLLKLSPLLIHQLDQDGNDPILYLCLHVSGCRHRLIEFLIKVGSDLSCINSKNINFFNALQMTRNKKLLNKLIEHEIIQINYISTEVKQVNHNVIDSFN
ncbi:unnamed protein product [Adineta steineri]|uniref:Ankyrin repeat protein n=1 Tax=Adineta steineri TaxID=433720 RepID=A0A815MGA3_9BILA|nr:unnamed protein product [Adineta steineri]CAF1421206.1 unnamed protein product [Adineta steineri]